VTDCGRARPVGEGHTGELGTGYVLLVDALLNSVYPDRKIRVTNMGISGNTSPDLLERWQQDVLDLSPDWVFIMIGINDIWFQFDCQYHKELHIPFEQYVSNVEKMVESAADIGTKVILMSPFFIRHKNTIIWKTIRITCPSCRMQ
jgi:lysophospholipase L1-like esterase